MKHSRELNGQGTTHIFERISFHLDGIQDLAPGRAAQLVLSVQKRASSSGAGWDRGRTASSLRLLRNLTVGNFVSFLEAFS